MSWYLLPIGLQALVITVDEFLFHHQRGLPTWERWGHPIDTLSVLACLALCLFAGPANWLSTYIGLSIFSCLLITKDEWIHHTHSSARENWLHSLLFILHPVILYSFGALWWQWKVDGSQDAASALYLSTAAVSVFFVYQVIYWIVINPKRKPEIPKEV